MSNDTKPLKKKLSRSKPATHRVSKGSKHLTKACYCCRKRRTKCLSQTDCKSGSPDEGEADLLRSNRILRASQDPVCIKAEASNESENLASQEQPDDKQGLEKVWCAMVAPDTAVTVNNNTTDTADTNEQMLCGTHFNPALQFSESPNGSFHDEEVSATSSFCSATCTRPYISSPSYLDPVSTNYTFATLTPTTSAAGDPSQAAFMYPFNCTTCNHAKAQRSSNGAVGANWPADTYSQVQYPECGCMTCLGKSRYWDTI